MERLLTAVMKVIYSDESHQKIMQMIQDGSRPDQALADVTTALLLEMDRQSGGRIPETVILPGAMAILSMLAEVAQAARLLEADDSTMTSAAQQITLSLLQEYGVEPADVQALIAKFDPAKAQKMVAQQQEIAGRWAGGGGKSMQAQQPPAQGVVKQPQIV